MDRQVLRILDANLNRATEGARVVEDYARFVLDDAASAERLKRLRHGLRNGAAVFEQDLSAGLEQFRDTPGDVGTALSTEAEAARASAADTARASIKRLEQALRVLAEYGKMVSGPGAEVFERLRYDTYALESLLFSDQTRTERLRLARLYVLVTEALASTDARTACREAVAGGADIVQMREKELEDAAFYECAEELCAICREGGALFVVNDRVHIAHLTHADGVHLGQGDLAVHLARRLLGHGSLIGRSTRGPAFAEAALAEGADYIGVGPVFATATKEHRVPAGLGYVRHAAQHVALPHFCIGGVNRETLGQVLAAGGRRVAVCTAIIAARDIAAEAAWFKEQIVAAGSA